MIRSSLSLGDVTDAGQYDKNRKYWRRRDAKDAARCRHTVICDVCGEPFETTHPTAKRHPAKDPTHDCYWRHMHRKSHPLRGGE